jgi:hypothetical protein
MSKTKGLSKTPKDKDEQNDPGTLPGWPGYRTRDGRTGYDPIDTRIEGAHTAGTILQKLFTGRIRSPIYLLLLGALGLVLLTPLVLAISELMNGNLLPWNAWIFLLITGIAGLAILVNFFKNLARIVSR